jgi:RES domain-containing protein
MPDEYVWSYAHLPVEPEEFNELWDVADHERTRQHGTRWIVERRSLGLAVPSIIVPHTRVDHNVLLNPTHDLWSEIIWEPGGNFEFDTRLFEEASA